MSAGTILAWGAWLAVLFNVNPSEAGWVGHGAFFLTLFLALVGTLGLLGTLMRVHVLKRAQVILREVNIAVRHAILLSAMMVFSLFLSVTGWFTWWSFLILLVCMVVFEYIALMIQESKRS